MKLRDILVFLDGGSAAEGRLQLAINIAWKHGKRPVSRVWN
jgi:hypothetical protein